jgi:hypothetical protein
VSYYTRSATIVFGQITLALTLEKSTAGCQKRRGCLYAMNCRPGREPLTRTNNSKYQRLSINQYRGLRLFQDGKRCQLEPEKCSFVCRSMDNLKKHWRAVHNWTATGRWGGSRAAASLHVSFQKQADAWKPVCCQRFFHTGRHTSYFAVLSQRRTGGSDARQRVAIPDSIAASVLQDLAAIKQEQEKRGNIASEETSDEETSPWLQPTR